MSLTCSTTVTEGSSTVDLPSIVTRIVDQCSLFGLLQYASNPLVFIGHLRLPSAFSWLSSERTRPITCRPILSLAVRFFDGFIHASLSLNYVAYFILSLTRKHKKQEAQLSQRDRAKCMVGQLKFCQLLQNYEKSDFKGLAIGE